MNEKDSKNRKSDEARQPQDVVEIVDDLLARAVAAGASDVHFEPTGADLKVKYRLDGVLNLVESLPASSSRPSWVVCWPTATTSPRKGGSNWPALRRRRSPMFASRSSRPSMASGPWCGCSTGTRN